MCCNIMIQLCLECDYSYACDRVLSFMLDTIRIAHQKAWEAHDVIDAARLLMSSALWQVCTVGTGRVELCRSGLVLRYNTS